MPKQARNTKSAKKAIVLRSALAAIRAEKISPKRLGLVALLLLAGVALWLACDPRRWYTPRQFTVLALFIALACVPEINARLGNWLDALRHPTPRRCALVALSVGLVAGIYLLVLTFLEHQAHFPRFHDESMHLIQAQLLARGRLWTAPHPLPQFFETFFVFVTPVYAPMQFPGASMLYVPGIWIDWPYWITSLLIAAATVGLMYRVVAQVIDGVAGMLAALWLLASADFRYYGLMVLSYPVALLLGVALVWAWLRWRERKTAARCAVIGLLAGWAAITRPADALCFALPVGIAMLLDLASDAKPPGPGWRSAFARRAAASAAILCLSAAPFLAIQLIFNRGVTGSWLQTPHSRYVQLFHPRIAYGMGSTDALVRPATTLPQKIDYYDSFVLGHSAEYTKQNALKEWLTHRLPILLQVCLPRSLAIVLLPCGLLGLTTRGRWVMAGVLPLFVAFYALMGIFAATYTLIAAAAVIPLALLGERAIEDAWGPARRFVVPLLTILLAGIGVMGLPSLIDPVREQYEMPTLQMAEEQMATLPGRAVVFCRYRRGDNLHEEPVFNTTAADIDAARIVRAQDLGALENIKLFKYYRQRQPDRAFYRFDRKTAVLERIDPQRELEAAREPVRHLAR